MTATNMCSNFGVKWDSPPKMDLQRFLHKHFPPSLCSLSGVSSHKIGWWVCSASFTSTSLHLFVLSVRSLPTRLGGGCAVLPSQALPSISLFSQWSLFPQDWVVGVQCFLHKHFPPSLCSLSGVSSHKIGWWVCSASFTSTSLHLFVLSVRSLPTRLGGGCAVHPSQALPSISLFYQSVSSYKIGW